MLIRYTQANIYRCRDLRLIPGVNDVPEKVWNEVKDHPLVKARLQKGVIVPLPAAKPMEHAPEANPSSGHSHSGDQGAGADGLVSLNGFGAKEAEALVKETFDLPTLERWAGEETRKGVLKAIEAQIESLKVEGEENEGNK